MKTSNKKTAFTLAEVLITLAIIGVVAVLTVPTLVSNYKKKTIETKLVRIYSLMNQAISLSEIENGPKETWNFESDNFWDTYFDNYIKSIKKEDVRGASNTFKCIYFADGSMLMLKTSHYISDDGSFIREAGKNNDFYLYPEAKNFNIETYLDEYGINLFSFKFAPNLEGFHKGKGFEVYLQGIDTTENLEEQLINGYYGCNKDNTRTRNYCTALIKHNNWKIPDDYPFKF